MSSSALVTNPFGLPRDPRNVAGYVAPVDVINAILFQNSDALFAYKSFSDPALLHAALQKWAAEQPSSFYQELDIRSGAGLAPLGYLSNTSAKNATIVSPGYALPYFHDSLSSLKNVLLNVGALNYDQTSGSITNDYLTPLNVASQYNYNVITPINNNELQKTTLLSLALTKFGVNTINLFDGVSSTKTILPVNANEIVQDSQEILNKLTKLISTPTPSFDCVLDKFNQLTGWKLHNFQYFGSETAETVFITYGTLESELFQSIINENSNLGLISIRIPLPFDLEKFVQQIPTTTKNLVVIGQSVNDQSPSDLKSKVSAALFYHGNRSINVADFIYEPNFIWSNAAVNKIISAYTSTTINTTKDQDGNLNVIYWNDDKNENLDLTSRISVSAAASTSETFVNLRTKFDNITNAGTFQAQLTISPSASSIISNIDVADASILGNVQLLKGLNILTTLKDHAHLIVQSPKDLAELDLVKDINAYVKNLSLPFSFLQSIIERGVQFTLINTTANDSRLNSIVTQAVFWDQVAKLSLPEIVTKIVAGNADWELNNDELLQTLDAAFNDEHQIVKVDLDNLSKLIVEEQESIAKEAATAAAEEKEEEQEEPTVLPSFLIETGFGPNNSTVAEPQQIQSTTKSEIAKILSFKDAYGVANELRPDLPVENFVVKVKENRRVTNDDYDRYIFHIEFDITGTGLKYDIGEASFGDPCKK